MRKAKKSPAELEREMILQNGWPLPEEIEQRKAKIRKANAAAMKAGEHPGWNDPELADRPNIRTYAYDGQTLTPLS